MKKVYILLALALALVLALCACGDTDDDLTPPSAENDQSVDPTDDDYLEITPRNVGVVTPYTLVFEGHAMSVPLPVCWSFEEKRAGGYDIYRDGVLIGRAEHGFQTEASWRVVSKGVCNFEDGSSFSTFIEKLEKESGNTFRYRLQFTASEVEYFSATFFIAYEELDQPTLTAISRDAIRTLPENMPNHGVLGEFSENSKVILLGNSFIHSSQIGKSLQALFTQAEIDTEVVAVSRGYAHVGTYVADTAKMQEIRGGVYDMVFICGLYTLEEVENLKILKQACDDSDTPLVLLPAHNESKPAIDRAIDEVQGIYYLPWQDEINALIASGVEYFDMCVDDVHRHSTPLAGYVGAHMIFRALFDASPKTLGVPNLLDASLLEEKLGRAYLETGTVCIGKTLFFS